MGTVSGLRPRGRFVELELAQYEADVTTVRAVLSVGEFAETRLPSTGSSLATASPSKTASRPPSMVAWRRTAPTGVPLRLVAGGLIRGDGGRGGAGPRAAPRRAGLVGGALRAASCCPPCRVASASSARGTERGRRTCAPSSRVPHAIELLEASSRSGPDERRARRIATASSMSHRARSLTWRSCRGGSNTATAVESRAAALTRRRSSPGKSSPSRGHVRHRPHWPTLMRQKLEDQLWRERAGVLFVGNTKSSIRQPSSCSGCSGRRMASTSLDSSRRGELEVRAM